MEHRTELGRDYKTYCEARFLIENSEPTDDVGCAIANLMVNTDGLTCLYIWNCLSRRIPMLFAVHPFVQNHVRELGSDPDHADVRAGWRRRDLEAFKENDKQYMQFLSTKRFHSNRVLPILEAEEGEG